ncbi:MAG: hypothetical protein BRC58_01030 [Cyanobacteria bacterium QS_8_64_29]|nr:MAG: hypothetical protein BRC58_01030 [Cyanobacteria bacterium QS_8_64_29]
MLLAAICLLGGGVGDRGLPVAVAQSSSDKPAAKTGLPAAVAEAVLDEAARRSERERSALQVVSAEQRQWPNGCLRLAEPDEVCTQAIVEGWRVTVASPERRWIYRTDQQGQRIRLERQAQASTASFSDIANDPYREEVQTAREMGFIAGFDGNTFRPEQPLTREQAVSMFLEALVGIPQVAVALPSETKATPYSDIKASRWSAAKIAWAHQNGIVSGYGNGTFRPTAQVTRAELIAIERRAAQYAQQQRGQGRELAAVRNAESFADTEGHWAQAAIRTMARYCGVAAARSDTVGAAQFEPNRAARRNYAAAATVRMRQCVAPEHEAVRLERPSPNQTVASPLEIAGEARGQWYFEGDFPVTLRDANGQVVARSFVTAQDSWMQEGFVPFKGTLSFEAPQTDCGTLVLERDNPSALLKNSGWHRVPVCFSQ